MSIIYLAVGGIGINLVQKHTENRLTKLYVFSLNKWIQINETGSAHVQDMHLHVMITICTHYFN